MLHEVIFQLLLFRYVYYQTMLLLIFTFILFGSSLYKTLFFRSEEIKSVFQLIFLQIRKNKLVLYRFNYYVLF